MILLNLGYGPWITKGMKRNQAIFYHLLETEAFESGIYVNPPRARNNSQKSNWRLPYTCKTNEAVFAKTKIDILNTMFTLPFTWRKPILNISAAIIARAIKRNYIGRQPYLLWMNSIETLSVAIADKLAQEACIRIFDSSDDFIEFNKPGKMRDQKTASLRKVLALSDRVLSVNEQVETKLQHPNTRVFHNCTEFDNFQHIRADWILSPHFPKRENSRYIGFIGSLNRMRADFDLLKLLFERFPQCQFLFVGYIKDESIRAWLRRFPNADFVDAVPYDILPTVIHSFDVAIVPHLDNAHTRGNDLLKILDYFACGVPVVTTRSSNVEKYASACYIADTHEQFAARIGELLKGAVHNPAAGLEIARLRSWSAQVPALLPWVIDGSPLNR